MVLLNQPPGVVVKDEEGNYWTRCPLCLETGPLDHEVVEHEDHTATVTPSIMCDNVTNSGPCRGHFTIDHGVVTLV